MLSVGTHAIYRTPSGRLWYPGIITSISQYSGSCITTTPYVATYRCVRFHLKPYKTHTNAYRKWSFKPKPHKNMASTFMLKQKKGITLSYRSITALMRIDIKTCITPVPAGVEEPARLTLKGQ